MSPLRAVEKTQTPSSTSPENFSIAPIAACWKMSMRRSPFSAGSSIEPDTSITASMRERSVSTRPGAQDLELRGAVEIGRHRRRTLGGEARDVERARAVGRAEARLGEPVGLGPCRLAEGGEEVGVRLRRRGDAVGLRPSPESARVGSVTSGYSTSTVPSAG